MGLARADRLKRVTMRANRRGTKEMDLILGRYAQASLAGMTDAELDGLEALMNENDQDLYRWVTRQTPAPERFASLIDRISEHAGVG